MAQIFFRGNKGPFFDGTTPAMRYEAKKQAFMQLLAQAQGGDHKALDWFKAQKHGWDQVLRGGVPDLVKKDIGPSLSDVQGVPVLSNMSVQYANKNYIGRLLFPLLPVQQVAGTYTIYDERYQLQVPNTKGGGVGGGQEHANEVSQPKTKGTYTCESDELMKRVGFDVVLNQENPPFNEMFDLVEQTNQLMELAKEVEYASIATDANNYPTGNKTTLTAGIRWDEPGGDPVADIQTARAALWEGTGSSMVVAATNIDIWNVLARNADLLDLLSLTDKGLVKPSDFAQYFGLDGVLISEARKDTANIGQTASYDRIWGNYFVLMRVSETPQLRNATFGYTPRWMAQGMNMGTMQQQWYDPKVGPFGSFYYKKAWFEDIIVTASKTGYLYTTPIN